MNKTKYSCIGTVIGGIIGLAIALILNNIFGEATVVVLNLITIGIITGGGIAILIADKIIGENRLMRIYDVIIRPLDIETTKTRIVLAFFFMISSIITFITTRRINNVLNEPIVEGIIEGWIVSGICGTLVGVIGGATFGVIMGVLNAKNPSRISKVFGAFFGAINGSEFAGKLFEAELTDIALTGSVIFGAITGYVTTGAFEIPRNAGRTVSVVIGVTAGAILSLSISISNISVFDGTLIASVPIYIILIFAAVGYIMGMLVNNKH